MKAAKPNRWSIRSINCRRCILPWIPIRMGVALFFTAICFFMNSDTAYAIQGHPGQEGLYVHQVAHVFFGTAMALLAYWLEKNRFTVQKGWRLIQISCLLFVLWNVTAFFGHVVEGYVPNRLLLGKPDWSQRIFIRGEYAAQVYYLLKMDHLVCVPAIWCLLLGIRSLYRQVSRQEKSTDG